MTDSPITDKIADLSNLVAMAKDADEALMLVHITLAHFAASDNDIPNELCKALALALKDFQEKRGEITVTNGNGKSKLKTKTENENGNGGDI